MATSHPPSTSAFLLLGAALASASCAAAPPRSTSPASAAKPWTLTMLGGECTLAGQGDRATAGACAALGSFDLRDDPAAGRLGAMVASLAPASPGRESVVGGWPDAQLAVAGARPTATGDGWIPIAHELKAILRARPAATTTTTLATPTTYQAWSATTSDGTCTVTGRGAQVLAVACPGVPSTPGADLDPLLGWVHAAAIDRTAAAPTPCALTTALAAPYPVPAVQCAQLATILQRMVADAAQPPSPLNKLDAGASIALAQLADGDDPVVDVLMEWIPSPADRDRVVALGGAFTSTDLAPIQGLHIALRALPAVAALTSVTRLELGQALTADGRP
ncbi:MAG: hypothetical protein R3B06_32595 [Kofleriaceae bacterium]